MKQNKVFTYGRHALSEALKYAPHAVTKVYLDSKMADTKIRRQIDQAGLPIARLSEGMARSDMKSGVAHQGIIGSISIAQLVMPLQKFLDTHIPSKDSCIVILDGVQDPHNVGAIIRSAVGFGAAAVIIPERGTAAVTGTVIKVSSGMAFRIPLVASVSATQAALELKKKGYKVYALAGESSNAIDAEVFNAPAAFMLGNEAGGVGSDERKAADKTLSIPMDPRCESLNVAASAAVALYAWRRAIQG
jgi:23S rRNA (guanosine2251-2'-O)-methyltransferase